MRYTHASYSVILSCSKVFLGEKTVRSITSCCLQIVFLDKAENLGGDNFWMLSKPALNKLQNRFSKIWQNIINVWADINDNNHTAPENGLIQHRWYYTKIKVANKQVFPKKWCKRGFFLLMI